MNKLIFAAFIAIAMIFGSCKSNQNLETLTIASERGDCVGVAPMKCLLIKKEGQDNWEYLYQEIEGFTYEPGYEYKVEVLKQTIENPAADQSSIRYILEKQISKTEKTSENLPV